MNTSGSRRTGRRLALSSVLVKFALRVDRSIRWPGSVLPTLLCHGRWIAAHGRDGGGSRIEREREAVSSRGWVADGLIGWLKVLITFGGCTSCRATLTSLPPVRRHRCHRCSSSSCGGIGLDVSRLAGRCEQRATVYCRAQFDS